MLAIINAELIMRDHLIPNAVLLSENGIITGFGEMRSTHIPKECEIIDAGGAYLGPGLIDIHTHAGGDVSFEDDPLKAASQHLRHGSTSVFPALYFSRTQKELIKQIERIRASIGQSGAENIVGLYMEAPYMNPEYGSDRSECPWANPIDPADYMPLLEAAGTDVRVWVVAPERERILDFVLDAKRINPSVHFSVGHSEAAPYQIEALMPYGLNLGTHHTNATGTLIKYPECRGVCVDEAVNYNRDIFAELICDSRGIHVDPYMLRLVRRIKGDDRIILISDQVAGVATNAPGYEDVTDVNVKLVPAEDGSGMCLDIDGSKLTLDVACRNMMRHTGASIVDVFQFASYNPSRAVGLSDRGEIAVGKRADLILTDGKMNVQTVIIGGKIAE